MALLRATPELEGLQDFMIQSPAELPPVFVGREMAIRDIERTASNCWQSFRNRQAGPHKNTRVLFGAPGAGKSSTLMHLERSWPGPGGGAPVMLRLPTPADFVWGPMLAEKLADLLGPGLGKQVHGEVSRSWSMQAGIGGFGGQYSREVRQERTPDPIGMVLRHVPGRTWSGPLVIAIDEFQNMGGDRYSPQAGVLGNLHEQAYAAPITLVLAGLGDTVAAAARLGISRLHDQAVHSLGCFAPEESAELIAGWSRHFGLPDGPWQGVMLDLAAACDHWPVHVQNALSALAEEIVVREGDMSRLDLEAVRRRSGELQENYYRSRMSPEMRVSKLLLAAVMNDLRSGMDSGAVMDAINEHTGSGSGVGWQLPRGMDELDYFNHLVHRGALQEQADFSVNCPIPSFRRFMAAFGKPVPKHEEPSEPDPGTLPPSF